MSYSAMSKRVRNPYETLERMLNKTTLSTQRVAHSNIVELGAHMVSSKAGDFQEEHEKELQQAVDESEERATRELKAALKRLREDKDHEKSTALRNQKEYYEKIQRRVEEQRNRAEEERDRENTKKFIQEKEEALAQQWEECERLKEEAVALACEKLTHKLKLEFAYEKEQAVAEALRIAKEKYLIRERNTIEKTRRECEEAARQEAERVAKLHQQDIDRCNERYNLLERKWLREIDCRKNVEQDFRELQDDYRRFMDYTDGMFHSDYLMQLRHMGQRLAEKQIKAVTYEDIEKNFESIEEEPEFY
ncbi:trichohyalin-like isoform X2 [Ruditapes philippinarum]|uniref:trichohyalin-like isoform X2 n=1 Tax=Ruditapes philippinarum TaxID=129788 RepID=UPI00295AAF09|nr:trichohyalin-like isoform X2 [Ruditapes philippinarum]